MGKGMSKMSFGNRCSWRYQHSMVLKSIIIKSVDLNKTMGMLVNMLVNIK